MNNKNIWNLKEDRAKRNIFIHWMMSYWCNFNCSYCFFSNHKRKQDLYKINLKDPKSIVKNILTRNKSGHAFDNYSAEEWVNKIKEISNNRKLSLEITGGEPFLDKTNFLYVLNEFSTMDEIDNIRINTNGSFLAEPYSNIDLSKIFLMISYHPEHISLSKLKENIKSFQKTGFNVPMINYVMTPELRKEYDKVRDEFAEINIAVNPGVYEDGNKKTDNDIELYSKYLNKFDVSIKCNTFNLKSQYCHLPQIGFNLTPDGTISNLCLQKKKADLFKSDRKQIENLLTEKPVKCPKGSCRCINMYSFLANCNRNNDSMNILKNYVDDAILNN